MSGRPCASAPVRCGARLSAPLGHLEHVLRIYTTHYNRERPHRGLALIPPTPQIATTPWIATNPPTANEIEHHDKLGGLIHEYHRTAA
jgi:hypothetical protein